MPVSTVTQPAPAMVTSRHWPVPEERRTVSVLFVDIVGSTALVDRLDPEDVRALQLEYFGAVAGVLRRWNGVVEKYVGDAVMALFGGVESDGFDAYRAVRAGLEIQRVLDGQPLACGTRVRLRVGVATGEAVVDLAAVRDAGHGAVSGAVVTLAARLQEHAPHGTVIVCAATRRATADLIDYRELPPAVLAGKPAPVTVWRAAGPGPVRPAGGELPFIGRRRELAALRDQVARAVRDRTARWVSVVGPDGVGRSRLLTELARTVGQVDGVPVRWCRAQCPPDVAAAPLAALVRDHAGLRADDDPATVRRRLSAVCGPLVPAGRLSATVAALGTLLGPTPDAAAAGAARWREVLLALAEREPLVVAVDDVDRAAPEVGRFLHELFAAATARRLPLAVVVTHRPEWADLLPLGSARRRHRLTVPPLRAVDAGRLLRHLVGERAAVARLLPLVAGYPGYARAYAAQAGDGGAAGEPPVPEAVHRMVSARLDRLDGTGRAVVMAGAALGAGFTADQVARLLDLDPGPLRPVLRELVARGVLVWRAARHGYDVADRTLARVAYERLPRALRAEFRRRTAPVVCDGPPRPVRLAHPAASGRLVAAGTPAPDGRPVRTRPVGVPARAAPPLAASA
ncbi:AAA ATPase domain-containing protein [Micromonospora pallida]|uniref:AAA ATPase domain-containing protein n=1 Tax=Micromonospora pallida TaxID=145854 RepID=A0A1C6S6M9_9ACTN|nr:adenylate/guanylate cyclase domain-containing protein [Micromonospora pallida]SCL24926.1 AAA ATPase domain-containing protein [Micromonospora pallida]